MAQRVARFCTRKSTLNHTTSHPTTATRDLLASGGAASWAAHPSATQVQCPAFNASLLPPRLREQGLYVAANLRDNEGVMANFIRSVSWLGVGGWRWTDAGDNRMD